MYTGLKVAGLLLSQEHKDTLRMAIPTWYEHGRLNFFRIEPLKTYLKTKTRQDTLPTSH